MEFKTHHIATIIALINSAKKHQWTLELKCKSFMRLLIAAKYLTSKYLLIIKGRKVIFWWKSLAAMTLVKGDG